MKYKPCCPECEAALHWSARDAVALGRIESEIFMHLQDDGGVLITRCPCCEEDLDPELLVLPEMVERDMGVAV